MTKAGPMLFSLSDEIYGPGGSPPSTGNLQYRYSSDGITWAQSELPNQTRTQGDRERMPGLYDENKWIAYGNGVWTIPASYNTNYSATTLVRTSTDGITWTEHVDTMPKAYSFNPTNFYTGQYGIYNWYATIFDGTKFVAMSGDAYYQQPIVMNSDDGINWTQVSPRFTSAVVNGQTEYYVTADSLYLKTTIEEGGPGNYFHRFEDMATDNNVIVAAGFWEHTVPYYHDSPWVFLSHDHGVHWTKVEAPIQAKWDRVEYGNGVFIMLGRQELNAQTGASRPVAIRSIDGGLSWVECSLPSNAVVDYYITSLAYGDGNWVICRSGQYDDGGKILVSIDGGQTFDDVVTDPVKNNYNQEMLSVHCYNVEYFNNRFVAIWGGEAGGSGSQNLLQVSASVINAECSGITIPQLQSIVAASTDFADFQTRIAAL